MDSPELSIVVPVYNVDSFLIECLSSIATQTFTDWECILVDDGSTDFSGIICDSFARKDSRFRVIHQRNMGVSMARNAGINVTTAPLLAFIDPDDFISQNFYEVQITEMRRVDADVSVALIYLVSEDGTEGDYFSSNYLNRRHITTLPKEMNCNLEVQNALCRNLFSCVCWGKVYKRALWGNARFPPGIDLGEDMLTIPRTIIRAEKAVLVNEAVYYWRQRKKSLLHGTVSYERLVMDIMASSQMVKQLCEYSPTRELDFIKLKYQYDVGCLENYFASNLDAKKAKSTHYVLHMVQEEANRRLSAENGDYHRIQDKPEETALRKNVVDNPRD